MSGQGGESEDLYLLATLLEQLVEGQYDLWQQVAGRRELLRSALRQAMRAASISSDVASLLERCWDLLSDERTSLRVAEFYGRDPDYEQVTVDHERVLLGALRLAVTAQAAVAALQVGRVGDAASRLDRWSRVAVGLFGQSGELEEHKLEDEPVENSAELVRRVYRRLGNGADGALFWTLEWLESTSAEKVVKVPVVGYHPSVSGFCADLRLRLIAGEGELVEHPDMALRPLGPELREVIRDACQAAASAGADGARSRSSVCWLLTVRDRSLDPLVPLDGGSLSGAARAGLLLLRGGGCHDPRSVIVARAEAGGELRPVGFERDKLEAASSARMRQAVVAPGAALSEADRDDLEARGLKLRKAVDIAEAVRLVRARRTRTPIAMAAAAALVIVGALLISLFRDGSITTPAQRILLGMTSSDPAPNVWDDNWHHVAMTYDKRTLRWLVDGRVVSEISAGEDIVYGLQTTDALFIGAFGNTTPGCGKQPYVGDLDEVAIWNRALGPDEILRRASGQDAGDHSGLMGLWHFDEGSGDSVADASGNAYNGRGMGEPLSWVGGRFGKAIRLSGNNYVKIEGSPKLAAQRVTVEAWVRAARSPGKNRYLLGKGANGCNVSSYALSTGMNGELTAYVAKAPAGAPASSPSATTAFGPSDCGSGRKSANGYFDVNSCMRHNGHDFTTSVIIRNRTSVTLLVAPERGTHLIDRDGSHVAALRQGNLPEKIARPGEQVTWTEREGPTSTCIGIQSRTGGSASLWASSPLKDAHDHICPDPPIWRSGPQPQPSIPIP